MKKLNLKRLMAVLSLAVFAGFAGCNTEDVDYPIAELEVTPNMLDFELDGSATETASFEINTNRKWKIEFEDKSVEWVRVSKTEGDGSEKITLSLLPNQAETRSTRLKITASIYSTYVTVKQTGSITSTELYKINFGVDAPNAAPSGGRYPYLDEWTESLGESGEGRSTVTHDGSSGVSLRQSGMLSSGYTGASGENKLFFGAGSNFTVNTITTTGYSNFKITFGIAHYSNGVNNFTTDKMELHVSADGVEYTPVGYDASGDHDTANPPTWWYCTTYVQDLATDKLYVRFVAKEDSSMSFDDLIVTGLSSATPSGPKVTTLAASNVTETSAVLGGSYTSTSTPTQLGIEYKAGDGPFTRETYTGEIKSPFTITMTGLTTGANYTYRAYAIIDGATITGENVTFRPGSGGGPSGDELYIENCGTSVEKVGENWPYVDEFTGWQKGGTLSQSGVTYAGSSASVRNSGNAYEPSGSEASGAPYVFLGSGTPYFDIKNINVTGYNNFTFKMTVSFQESYSGGPVFGAITSGSFKLQGSTDGSTWTKIPFTPSSSAAATWVEITAGFKTSGANALYLRISEPGVVSVYRFDDFKLVSGGGDSGPTIGGSGPGPVGDELYIENCGTSVEKDGEYWPYVDAFTGWQKGGALSQSGVTYTGSSASVRNSGNAYQPSGSEASGAPYVFLGTGTPVFNINNINITGYDNFTFSLTASLEGSYTSGSVTWGTITTNSFKLQASTDGSTWTDLTYTLSGSTGWVTAQAGFKTSGASTLYVRISEPSVVSKYRFDDFKLISGGGDSGPTVGDGTDPGPGPDPGEGGVFFSETCGTGSYPSGSRPKVNAFTDWDMKSPVAYSDSYGVADIRSTTTINAHIWFPAPTTNTPDNTSVLKIEGITSNNNVTLSYDIASQEASVEANIIKVRCNGSTMLSIPSTTLSATANTYSTITIAVPDGTTTLEFMSDTNNVSGYRIDNIKLSKPESRR